MSAVNYVTNGEISTPLSLPNITADVDLGGMSFSYEIGMFYTGVSTMVPVKLPPPFEGYS